MKEGKNMNKDKDLKVRVSDKNLEDLNFCQEQLNISKSAAVRLAIEILTKKIKQERGVNNLKNKMYIEEVKREATEYHAINAWNKEELIEVIQHQLDSGNESEREAIAEKMVEKIDAGEVITLGKVYISEYRVASEEDMVKAKKEKETFDAEVDAMPMPNFEELVKLTTEYKANR